MNAFTKLFRLRLTSLICLAAAILGGGVFGLSAWLEQTYQRVNGAPGAQLHGWEKKVQTWSKYDLFQSLELTLFDMRATQAARSAPDLEPLLGLVALTDDTVINLRLGHPLVEKMGLLPPRKVYGRVLRELTAQGAKAVGFDVLLSDARPDHRDEWIPGPTPGSSNRIQSDTFFAQQIAVHGHVILASLRDAPPAPGFRAKAYTLGGVASPRDPDGSARRIRAFEDCRFLGGQLVQLANADLGMLIAPGLSNTIRLSEPDTKKFIDLTINSDGDVELPFDGKEFVVPAYEDRRVWHMGVVLAAIQLGLDLEKAEIQPNHIILRGTNGVERVIPTDPSHMIPVDWCVVATGDNNGVATKGISGQFLEELLRQDMERQANPGAATNSYWKDKLVMVGSLATGNNLADLGATPLAKSDFLVSTYFNVANSILQNRFVHRWPFAAELAIQIALSLCGGLLTWRLRISIAALCVGAISLSYVAIAIWVYVHGRLWLPIVHPLLGGLLLNHAVMLTWRVVFEQAEQKRVRSVFSKIVSPDVVLELLKADRIGLSGARRSLTVFFADIRGFTEMTDRYQVAAEEYAKAHQLTGAAAEAYFEQQAGVVLATVNLYLAAIADVIKFHKGTLDKYIGDCVMAFWGAPGTDAKHAVNCVLAAIDAQRAIERLNQERGRENTRREEENKTRVAAGQEPLPMLTQLALGTGINTGIMTVGLMGSDAHILNYTVFGREVNLASRLESVSGRSRIIIGQGTYEDLQKYAPELTATCVALEPVTVKGFRQAVPIYEVPWRQAEAATAGAPAAA